MSPVETARRIGRGTRRTENWVQLFQFGVLASDPDGDALAYGVEGLPPGAVFDVTSRTFSWTAGVLVSVMNEFGKLDRARANLEKRTDPPA